MKQKIVAIVILLLSLGCGIFACSSLGSTAWNHPGQTLAVVGVFGAIVAFFALTWPLWVLGGIGLLFLAAILYVRFGK